MILGIDDPYFKTSARLISFKPIADSKGKFKEADVVRFMQQINAIQSAQIAEQSRQRIAFFQRQLPFDEKLQLFFKSNATLHKILSSPLFEERAIQLIDSCESYGAIRRIKLREPWKQALRDQVPQGLQLAR